MLPTNRNSCLHPCCHWHSFSIFCKKPVVLFKYKYTAHCVHLKKFLCWKLSSLTVQSLFYFSVLYFCLNLHIYLWLCCWNTWISPIGENKGYFYKEYLCNTNIFIFFSSFLPTRQNVLCFQVVLSTFFITSLQAQEIKGGNDKFVLSVKVSGVYSSETCTKLRNWHCWCWYDINIT